MATIDQAIQDLNRLKEHYGEQEIAMAIWTEDDVLNRAKKLEIPITKEQAQYIIGRIYRNHNKDIGISWDTIDVYVWYMDGIRQHLLNMIVKKEA